MEAKSYDNPETFLESIGRPAAAACLQVTTNSPSRKCRELPIQIAVDVAQGFITEFAHLNSFIGVGLGRRSGRGGSPANERKGRVPRQ